MNKQLTHNEFKHEYKKFNITIVLDNLEHLENIGSAFRLSDAFCVSKIIIIDDKQLFLEDNAKKNYNKLSKTARNCMNYVPYEIMPTSTFSKRLKGNEILIALEITSESKLLQTVTFDKKEELIFIVGNEKYGISETLLNLCNKSIHINMFGNNSSLNVSHALAILLYEVTNQLQK